MRALILCLCCSYSAWLAAQSFSSVWQQTYPGVGAFSSPRAVDLNGDGTSDIIIAAGIEGDYSAAGAFAIDGTDGSLLWSLPSRNQLYSSAIWQQVDDDATPDVYLAGRDAQLYCLSGIDGSIIWEFWPDSLGSATPDGWYNFYQPYLISDLTGDGIGEVLTACGGDATASPSDTLRPPGRVVLLDGADGTLLGYDTLPDGREIYAAPLLTDAGDIIVGSGGETVSGSYYRFSVAELLASDLSQAEVLISSPAKGFIATPALADLTEDGVRDLILPTLDGRLLALDLATTDTLWSVELPGTENYVSPTIGQFTDDDIPDVYGIFARNVWPFYSYYIEVVIDGATGAVLSQDTTSRYQLATAVAADTDADGYDELLLARNYDIGSTTIQFRHRIEHRDFNDDTITYLTDYEPGLDVFSSLLLTDLDDDAQVDIIKFSNPTEDAWYNFDAVRISRYSWSLDLPYIAWAGYMGTALTGQYFAPVATALSPILPTGAPRLSVYPNPTSQLLYVLPTGGTSWPSGAQVQLCDALGRMRLIGPANSPLDVSGLLPGIYFVRVPGYAVERVMVE